MRTEHKIILSGTDFEILKVENLNHDFPMHVHKRMCIGRIDSGRNTMIINSKKIILRKDDLYFIPANTPHRFFTAPGILTSYTVICAGDVNGLRQGIHCNGLFSKKETAKAIELIDNYIPDNSQKVILNDKIQSVKNYIENHYSENLNTGIIAEDAGICSYHLLHLFKNAIGISLHQYLIQVRIKKFKEIMTRNADITDAALSCGFYDQSHITRNFKKQMGITPQKYLDSLSFI